MERYIWSGAINKRHILLLVFKTLHNYYHTILDSLGCLFHYFHLKFDHTNLNLLVNKNHSKFK